MKINAAAKEGWAPQVRRSTAMRGRFDFVCPLNLRTKKRNNNSNYQYTNQNRVLVPPTEYHIIFPYWNYQNIDFVNFMTEYFRVIDREVYNTSL